ncbi:purine-cytosine permease family protein [Kitasatospora sp. NPDC096147]|uniref:purine-cytosine permease family protein n=1 Tax=Kitasatospora sp. NPDC096147 TaxID=3364093 RepID=UPI0038175307
MAQPPITRDASPGPGRGSDRAGQVETRGIDQVPDGERHGRPAELFAVWAAPNVSYLSFVVGAALVLIGLPLGEAVAVVLAGNLLWLLTGYVAISGPAAGTAGSVISRAMYGIRANRAVVAVTGWLISSLYLALNWSAASIAALGLPELLGLPGTVAVEAVVVCLIAGATVLVALFGHATIVRLYPALTVLLTVVFVVVSVLVVLRADWSYAPAEPLTGAAHLAALASGFTLVASAPLSYANSPDLARYLPRGSSPRAVALWTAAGAYLPSVVFTVVGVLAATSLDMTDPQRALEGVMPGWFVPVFALGVVGNTVANNAMTAYSAGLSVQSIGVRLPRAAAVLVVGAVGAGLTLFAVLVFDFLTAVNTMMELVVVVTGPCMGVFAADVLLRRAAYDGRALLDERPDSAHWYRAGINPAGVCATLVGIGGAVLCAGASTWSGPVADALGGVNLAVPVGVLGGAVAYTVLARVFGTLPRPAR